MEQLTVLSDYPLGHVGEPIPDHEVTFSVIVSSQMLEPADCHEQPRWLTVLRPTTPSEELRIRAGLDALLGAVLGAVA